jgi:hypothetical protein
MRPRLRIAVVVASLLLAAPVSAGQYPAWGDTEWIYASKRECCDEAIAIAQRYSAQACMNAGGVPTGMRGGVQRRGFCKWQSTNDMDGNVLFRCQSEASVPCR